MEPHPVPQDILNTEFKLFGSFTLKQFMTMLLACLAGVFIFLLQIPVLIKLPVAAVTVLTGISMAIIPNFATWLTGYIKAIFVSPRYVWVKETKSPDSLKGKSIEKAQETEKVSKTKSQRKVNLEEISLEKLLATRDNPRKTNYTENSNDPLERTPRAENLDRVFNSIFTKQTQKSHPATAANQNIQQEQEKKKLTTKDQYIQEINALKAQLGSIVKDQNHKEKEAEILHRLNDLYQDLKMMNVDMDEHRVNPNQQRAAQQVTNFQGEVQTVGQMVTGIVVTKKDKPVDGAKVIFTSQDKNVSMELKTLANGKFASNKKLPEGNYDVQILHPSYRFHTYKINVGPNKLPAYKLREK